MSAAGWAAAAVVVSTVAGLAVGFRSGVSTVAKQEIQDSLRRAKMTSADASLYRRAARTLADLSIDPRVPEKSRTAISVWLEAYERERDRP